MVLLVVQFIKSQVEGKIWLHAAEQMNSEDEMMVSSKT